MNLAALIGEQLLQIDSQREALEAGGIVAGAGDQALVDDLRRQLHDARAELGRRAEASAREIDRLSGELVAAKGRVEQLERELVAAKGRVEQLEREIEAGRPDEPKPAPQVRGLREGSISYRIYDFLKNRGRPAGFGALREAFPKIPTGPLASALWTLTSTKRVLRDGTPKNYQYFINPEGQA